MNLVINQKDREAMLAHNGNVLRIDRGTKWGNPFGDHAKGHERYRNHIWEQMQLGFITIAELQGLDGKVLAGWRAPEPCHGDVLAKAIAWAVKQPRQLELEL